MNIIDEYQGVGWVDGPETQINAENLNKMDEAIKRVYEAVRNIFQSIYPVGKYYISEDATNPGELFGGTWERIKDTFLLAAGDTYKVGVTGGESEVALTVDEIPEHMHMMNGGNTVSSINAVGWALSSNNLTSTVYGTNKAGGSQAHNNMPPYLAVYVWKRIA